MIKRLIGGKYKNKKQRLVIFGFGFAILLFFGSFFIKESYGLFESGATLNASIDQAIYIFGGDRLTFNIDPTKIIPSDSAYVYSFSIQNFNDTQTSDVDLEYYIKVRSTTNLPISIEMCKNESYVEGVSTNILTGLSIEQDTDGAFYRTYDQIGPFNMAYTSDLTDIYRLVVKFPAAYKNNLAYVDNIENIEISIYSNQVR